MLKMFLHDTSGVVSCVSLSYFPSFPVQGNTTPLLRSPQTSDFSGLTILVIHAYTFSEVLKGSMEVRARLDITTCITAKQGLDCFVASRAWEVLESNLSKDNFYLEIELIHLDEVENHNNCTSIIMTPVRTIYEVVSSQTTLFYTSWDDLFKDPPKLSQEKIIQKHVLRNWWGTFTLEWYC